MAKKDAPAGMQQRILDEMLKQPENKTCADCGARGPRWASTNLGVFVCIRCSGIHRNLGTHISKVKSVNLDKWTEEQLLFFQTIGNAQAKAIYEANIPDHFRRPNENDNYAVEQFIRDKYERRRFMAAAVEAPRKPKKTRPVEQQVQVQPAPQPAPAPYRATPAPAAPPQNPPELWMDAPVVTSPARPAVAAPPAVMSPPAPAAPKAGGAGAELFGDFQAAGASNSGMTKESIMSLYTQPIAPTVAPSGYRPGMQAMPGVAPNIAVPPGYVAVLNPGVPGGVMFVPAASLGMGAPQMGGAPMTYSPYGQPPMGY